MFKGCCGKGCTLTLITKILVIIGGINWGLVGLGILLGQGQSWNLVNLLLGSIPVLEAVIYVLVGVSAVMLIFSCECGKCTDESCASCCERSSTENNTPEMGM